MNWRAIKNLGRVKYFNISYVVLIAVPLLASTFETFNNAYHYGLVIPPMVKSLYAASILYAIAIAIYQYRCPVVVKEYENIQEYIDKNLEQYQNIAPDLKLNIVLTHLDKSTREHTRQRILTTKNKLEEAQDAEQRQTWKKVLDEELTNVYSSCVQAHLTKKYEQANMESPFFRWFSALMYILGSTILIVLLMIRTIIVFVN